MTPPAEAPATDPYVPKRAALLAGRELAESQVRSLYWDVDLPAESIEKAKASDLARLVVEQLIADLDVLPTLGGSVHELVKVMLECEVSVASLRDSLQHANARSVIEALSPRLLPAELDAIGSELKVSRARVIATGGRATSSTAFTKFGWQQAFAKSCALEGLHANGAAIVAGLWREERAPTLDPAPAFAFKSRPFSYFRVGSRKAAVDAWGKVFKAVGYTRSGRPLARR